MKIAWCLYGQPRNYIDGYKNINKFIEKNNLNCDFFIHCWFDNNMIGELYHVSPWRHIDINDRIIKKDTDINIIKLYNPKKYIFESPKIFNTEFINGTAFDINTSLLLKSNYNNTLSNLYSKFIVNNILQKYVVDNNINYDMIISSRIDILNDIIVDINTIDIDKLNVMYDNRDIVNLPDNFIITNLEIFNNYSSAFLNLKLFLDDKNILKDCKEITEVDQIASESCLIANLLYIYKDKDFIRKLINKRKDILEFYKV